MKPDRPLGADPAMIDPDGIYTLTDSAALTGRSYHQVVDAVQRGRLMAARGTRWRYQVQGADLIAWRDRVPSSRAFAEPVYRPVPVDPPRESPVEPPPPPPPLTLTPDEIRLIRTRLGLSQTQLANRLGFTQKAVTRWETGRAAPDRRAMMALITLLAQSDHHDPP